MTLLLSRGSRYGRRLAILVVLATACGRPGPCQGLKPGDELRITVEEPASVGCHVELGLTPGTSFRVRVVDHPLVGARDCVPARVEILGPVGDWTWTDPMPHGCKHEHQPERTPWRAVSSVLKLTS